jgi:hypothetical protein
MRAVQERLHKKASARGNLRENVDFKKKKKKEEKEKKKKREREKQINYTI